MVATITSSTVTGDSPQIDGRRRVHELHVDSLGVQYPISYLAAQATDAQAQLAPRATSILSSLSLSEVATNIAAIVSDGSLAVPTFAYSTVAANVAALRLAYVASTRTQAIMIGDYLASLTDVQLQNAFGLTALQVTTLRTNKLTPAAANAATIRASVGQ